MLIDCSGIWVQLARILRREWELDLGSIIQANIDRLKELLK